MNMLSIPKPSIEVRKITENDENPLTAFFESVISNGLNDLFHPHPFTPEMAHKIANYGGDDWYSGAFLKSIQGEKIIAYVMLRGWDEGFAIPSFGVCVLPSYQKKGIGYLLLYLSIVTARVRGSPAIRLKVYPRNQPAVNFYRKMGFQFQEQLEKDQLVGYLRFEK